MNLELVLQLPLDPLCYVAEGHLPLPQLWPYMQVQFRWNTETVPAAEISTWVGILIEALSLCFHLSSLEFFEKLAKISAR